MSARPPRAAPPRPTPAQASVSFSREQLDEDHVPSDMRRKKSLVRPDREKIEPGHRQWHYRSHVADSGRVDVMPSGARFVSCVAHVLTPN
jgi:hypothetical protein